MQKAEYSLYFLDKLVHLNFVFEEYSEPYINATINIIYPFKIITKIFFLDFSLEKIISHFIEIIKHSNKNNFLNSGIVHLKIFKLFF